MPIEDYFNQSLLNQESEFARQARAAGELPPNSLLNLKLRASHKVTTAQPKKIYSNVWGVAYQGKNDPNKIRQFEDANATIENTHPGILVALDEALPAFGGDAATDPSKLREAARQIAIWESNNGKYTKQIKGPARGYWMTEPATARDMLRTNKYLGKNALEGTGYSKKELQRMSNLKLSKVLEDPKVSAIFGIAKLIQGSVAKDVVDELR